MNPDQRARDSCWEDVGPNTQHRGERESSQFLGVVQNICPHAEVDSHLWDWTDNYTDPRDVLLKEFPTQNGLVCGQRGLWTDSELYGSQVKISWSRTGLEQLPSEPSPSFMLKAYFSEQ